MAAILKRCAWSSVDFRTFSRCFRICSNYSHVFTNRKVSVDTETTRAARYMCSKSDSDSAGQDAKATLELHEVDDQLSDKTHGNIKSLLDSAQTEKESSEEIDFEKLPSELFTDKSGPVLQTIEKRDRPVIDPSEKSIVLFPGQGAQFVGMGDKLLGYPNVKEIYQASSEILGYDILKLCLEGPKEELDKTIHCQPAVFVTSMAGLQKLQHDNPWAIENCAAAAGFSVGEFAALVFAGVIKFEDALRLVKVRAEAMQRASEAVPSGMISVMGRPQTRFKFVCAEAKHYCEKVVGMSKPVCNIANYLFPDGRVIAGNIEALQFISDNAKEFYLRNVKRLPVSGAFHTSLMQPAQPAFSKAAMNITFDKPAIQVHANVSGKPYRNQHSILKLLTEQIAKPVMWEQTMHYIYEREQGLAFPHSFEIGPGKQLGSLLSRVNAKARKSYSNIEV
ncbi:malonyl-CoA-acyl carrier protein transacylase, mitochondrial-like [Glandiceps talaboti]